MLRSYFLVIICLQLLIILPAAAQDCIDYQDYLHWVGMVDTPDNAWAVATSGTTAYVADYASGIQVIVRSPTVA